mmetsp:Transcript_31403/g.83556  ORF Transcript_31403/g.83556 Transcript_31403/m.83556 type:complete len:322 (+) Transcript_31403:1853-2818(+)
MFLDDVQHLSTIADIGDDEQIFIINVQLEESKNVRMVQERQEFDFRSQVADTLRPLFDRLHGAFVRSLQIDHSVCHAVLTLAELLLHLIIRGRTSLERVGHEVAPCKNWWVQILVFSPERPQVHLLEVNSAELAETTRIELAHPGANQPAPRSRSLGQAQLQLLTQIREQWLQTVHGHGFRPCCHMTSEKATSAFFDFLRIDKQLFQFFQLKLFAGLRQITTALSALHSPFRGRLGDKTASLFSRAFIRKFHARLRGILGLLEQAVGNARTCGCRTRLLSLMRKPLYCCNASGQRKIIGPLPRRKLDSGNGWPNIRRHLRC